MEMEQKLVWLTNGDPRDQGFAQYIRNFHGRIVLRSPKPSEEFSVEALEAAGIKGVYEVVSEADVK